MNLRTRMDGLERRMPEPRRITMVFADVPPDGRTRCFFDDGVEAPAGTPVPDDDAVQVLEGIDPDELTGLKKTDDVDEATL